MSAIEMIRNTYTGDFREQFLCDYPEALLLDDLDIGDYWPAVIDYEPNSAEATYSPEAPDSWRRSYRTRNFDVTEWCYLPDGERGEK